MTREKPSLVPCTALRCTKCNTVEDPESFMPGQQPFCRLCRAFEWAASRVKEKKLS